MTTNTDLYDESLARASQHARAWLSSVGERRVAPSVTADELSPVFGGPLPEHGCDPADVVDILAEGAEPGLMAMGSGRFFGWVMGGTLPAGLAADWLVSAWDQNAGMRYATPATAAIEHAAGQWLLELFGLPTNADVGFVTGATLSNFACLAAARYAVLSRVGWDVHGDGLTGAPKVHLLVGEERHATVDLAFRYLGMGRPAVVAADEQGRLRVDALAEALGQIPEGEPIVLCLQAGNLHSGAFDPFVEAIALAHERGAWVHVDGAFGLWAAASAELEHLTAGVQGADSWTTDAHKTLNVPFDCGIAIVADPSAMRSALGVHTSYLISDDTGPGDPFDKTPELSRRARGVPVWAVLRSLGRQGACELVERLVTRAQAIAEGIAGIEGAEILNDVVYTQVSVAFENDARTRAVTERLLAEGSVWMSGSSWQGRAILRVSVSNWATDEDDVRFAVEALRRAATAS